MLKTILFLFGLLLLSVSSAEILVKSISARSDIFAPAIQWFSNIFPSKSAPKKSTKKPMVDPNIVLVADYIVVNKSERKMYMKKLGVVVKEFDIALGAEPIGKKTRKGDLKTPEGLYRLGFKNSHSGYYKSVHISYPNILDRQQARVEKVNPGGAIVVHGAPNQWKNINELILVRGKDWTEGCIALSNKDMDIFWKMTNKANMFIKINP